MTPDVNVVVAASRSDHPHHEVARQWLEAAVLATGAGTALTLLPMVMASFLRLVTSPRVFRQSTPAADAVAFLDAIQSVPGVVVAPLGPEWPLLRRLCVDGDLRGNDLPDAWLAAAVLHLDEHLVSFDRDFCRLLGKRQLTLLRPT